MRGRRRETGKERTVRNKHKGIERDWLPWERGLIGRVQERNGSRSGPNLKIAKFWMEQDDTIEIGFESKI